ncbi:MAG TPA: nuclear transport factor 2 family protein [Burkholderiales bacterium]|nr:nuclear transport factor 2 family protein [Burkholderiales bacterium]
MTDANNQTALTQAIEAFYTAIKNKNAAAFEPLLTSDVSYGHSSGRMEDKAQFIANVLDPKTQWKSIYGAKQINTFSGDTAISRHYMAGENARDGKPGTSNMPVMMVWQKHGGAWKLLARQAFKL